MEFLDTASGQVLIGIFLAINAIAFFVMAHDKRQAVVGRNASRTPEVFMFFLATMLGSIGVFCGMRVFRHKTRTWYFQVGIPLLILQNIAAVYVVWQLIQAFA